MKRAMIILSVVLIACGLVFANTPLGDWAGAVNPGVDATGGPDAYGYTWIDSNEPGGPTLNWVDITAIGTEVGGLGDDNWVGPFSTGFPFHYYWYDITQYYIGSNGYLKFGTPYNMAQPFPSTIPLAALPNDFIAVYVGDWYPGQGGQGHVYRWTNNVDSLIVSFNDIPAWSTLGSHYFQVILTDTDSSITFQYGTQSGLVSNNDLLIGIENINGQVGLLHSADTYAPSNYVVRFEYPDNPTYVVHDMATVSSANENSEGFFVLSGEAVVPWAKVKNTGNQIESFFDVFCTIHNEAGVMQYSATVPAGPLNPGEEMEITFTPNWTPAVTGQYFFKVEVDLVGDMNPNNDIKTTETRVMTLPGDMLYDDGSSEQTWTWMGGDGGLGQHFVPPTYPVTLETIKYYITSSSTTLPFIAKVFDDDGPGGIPGTELFTQNVNATIANQWYTVDVSAANIEITDGGFYVSWHMSGENSPGMGMDSSATQIGSRQSWEFTGVWAPFRNAEVQDVMIRTGISGPSVVCDMTIDIEPLGGIPVVVPPGGSFDWTIAIVNNETFTVEFDVWIKVNQYYLVFGPATRSLPGGAAPAPRQFTQDIPLGAPPGLYTYDAYIGDYPTNTIWDSDFFPFTITFSGGDGGSAAWSANTFGDWLLGPMVTAESLPADSRLISAYPNPFNPTTAISYQLQASSFVNLSVYDIAGRKVAELVNGWRDAGSHEVAFDGSNLASGIYVYRLNTAGFTASGKMVLIK